MRRVLIVGNSASGKSTLARQLSAEHGLRHVDLDTHAWRPTSPPTRVPLDEAMDRLHHDLHDADTGWVVEGCYADLIAALSSEADDLVFLDPPVETCLVRARKRPWEPHKFDSKAQQDAHLAMLLEWIADYPSREGVLGRPAHLALLEAFPGRTWHVRGTVPESLFTAGR